MSQKTGTCQKCKSADTLLFYTELKPMRGKRERFEYQMVCEACVTSNKVIGATPFPG